ncbi:zinc ribbon domain-containing protein [Shewanella sp. YLB-07]|uniref:zinc ribbon domain-containing protein n=1 Tax=Shewanella sp. YLB-07 TaxID=2601268 RepID=UPI00128C7E85|nr:zinc ribbon domain-containing protein [Shewanella sp. YLB-07]
MSWSSFVDKLKYKAKQQGKHLVKIDPWFASSKTCHCCDHKVDKIPLNLPPWKCPKCFIIHDRDINAAINVKQQGIIKLKAEGLSVSANRGLRKTSHELIAV